MRTCEHCGRETPDERFCTWCGAQIDGQPARPRWRGQHYAAQPGEAVAQPSVISTLLPHLPSRRIHEFRWGLLAGVAAVVVLTAVGQVVAAIFAAAVLVPALYLVYLYEAQVYRDEPVLTLGLTIFAGAAIGALVLILAADVIPTSSPLQLAGATGTVLSGTVLLPIVEEVLKPLPALVLRTRQRFGETIDGLAFGVAVGLGFAAAQTVDNFSRVIGYTHLHTSVGTYLFPLLSAAVLMPLMQGSCTGALVASLWRRGRAGHSRRLYLAGPAVALVGHTAFTFVSWLLADHGASQATVLVWQVAVDAGLLVFIRHLVHRALIDEGEDFGFRDVDCPHCGRDVDAAAFCPHCGAALSAAPRTPHGGLRSDAPTVAGTT